MRGPNGQVVRVVPAVGPGIPTGGQRVVPIQLRPEGPARVQYQPGMRMVQQVHQMRPMVPRPQGSPSRQGVIQQVGGFQQGVQRFPTSFGPGVPGATQWRAQQPRMMRPEQPVPMRQFGPEMGQAPGQNIVRAPQPGAEGQGEIAYNVEHVFIENGKEVRKMPISHEGQTIWVECVGQNAAGHGVNTQQGRDGIMLEIPGDCSELEVPGSRPPGQVNPKPTGKQTSGAGAYDAEQRQEIVREVLVDLIAPSDLARKYKISAHSIRDWVKKTGKTLPKQYKKSEWGPPRPTEKTQSPHGSPKVTANTGMGPIDVVTSNINPMSGQLPQLPTAPVPPGQLEGVRPQVTTAGPPTPDSCQPGEASPSPASTPTSSIPSSTSAAVAVQTKIIPGKLAMCKWCGELSPDFIKCIRCKRKLPEDCKAIDDPQLKPKPDSTHETAKKAALRGVRIPNKSRRKGAASDEPVCIALSSDEEEDENSNMSSGQQSSSEINLEGTSGDGAGVSSLVPDENIFDGSLSSNTCTLACRSVRVGSYKVLPKDKIVITEKGVQIKVPAIMNNMEIVTITIPMSDVLKVLAHFGKSMPLLFLYISPGACKRARASLSMNSNQSFFIDITSGDETQKRVTILPEKLTDENKILLKRHFGTTLQEVESKEANEILVRSSPKDLHVLKQKMASANGSVVKKEEEASVVKYCQFPPEGTGTVSVTTEDYLCLEDEQFLNDVIIDFYMRYLQFGKDSSAHKQFTPPHFTTPLTEVDRDRVHIFSTYFYKRLTTRPKQVKNKPHPIEDNPNLSAAEKRYERVKKWTKKVNLFEKDFIVVPINEHAHWFVCVICFPGQLGCTRFDDNRPCSPPPSQVNRRAKKKRKERKPLQIGSTTIIPLKSGDRDFKSLQLEEEFSDRDEADASDDDMEDEADDDSNNSNDNQKDKNGSSENSKNGSESDEVKAETEDGSKDKNGEGKSEDSSVPKARVAIKRPCILVFDSLAGGSKAKVCATLRDYLTCEYRAKNETERSYTKETMPANAPKVQQQPNFSDCGIYVLQYIEMFFRIPIKDYNLPVTTLKSWFDEQEVRNKRESIAKLIRNLAEEQHPGKNIDYPEITFTAHDDDDDDDDDLDDTVDEDLSPTNNKSVNYVQVTSSGGSTPQMIRLTSGNGLKGSPRLVSTPSSIRAGPKGPQMLLCKTGDKLKLSPLPGVMGVPPGVTVTPARRPGVKITPNTTNTITVAQPSSQNVTYIKGPPNLGSNIRVSKCLPGGSGGFAVSQPVASSSNNTSEAVLQTSPDSTSNGNDAASPQVENVDNDDATAEYPVSDNENSDTFVPDSQGLESEDSNSSVKRRATDQEDPLGGKRIKPDS